MSKAEQLLKTISDSLKELSSAKGFSEEDSKLLEGVTSNWGKFSDSINGDAEYKPSEKNQSKSFLPMDSNSDSERLMI